MIMMTYFLHKYSRPFNRQKIVFPSTLESNQFLEHASNTHDQKKIIITSFDENNFNILWYTKQNKNKKKKNLQHYQTKINIKKILKISLEIIKISIMKFDLQICTNDTLAKQLYNTKRYEECNLL